MKIANIVSNNKIDVSEEFNVVQSMDEIIHGLPTLIVGYEYVNKHYPDFDILDIRIENNLYWTFKRTEKRDKFQEDLSWFIRKVYDDLTKEITYIFVDPLQYRSRTLWKIIRKIYSLKKIITYVHGDMIYLYGEKYLFGVDLKLLSYIGLNSAKIRNKIKSMSAVFLGADEILIEYKNTVEELGNKVRYVPYLFSIKNEQNDITSIIHIPRES